jgi:hypothetical protein
MSNLTGKGNSLRDLAVTFQALVADPTTNPQNPRKFRMIHSVLKPLFTLFFIINVMAYGIIFIDFFVSPILTAFLPTRPASREGSITVTLDFQGPETTDAGLEVFRIVLHSIELNAASEMSGPYCINKLFITGAIEGGWLAVIPDLETVTPTYQFGDLCAEDDYLLFLNTSSQGAHQEGVSGNWLQIADTTSPISSQRFYPFDSRRGKFALWLESDSSTALDIFPEVRVDSNKWRTRTSVNHQNLTINDVNHRVAFLNVTFSRPLNIRIASTLLLAVILGFTFVILFVPDIGSALQVSVAIILGLWGVREILAPESTGYLSLIDVAVLGIYLVLANVALIRFIIWPIRTRIKQHTDFWRQTASKPANLVENSNITTETNHARVLNTSSNGVMNSIENTSHHNQNGSGSSTRIFNALLLMPILLAGILVILASRLLRR